MTSGDWALALQMRRSRRLLIGAASLAYFAVVLFFGRSLLSWFGPEFRDGYSALCLITIGTVTATTFSMAPEYLKFAGQVRTLLWIYVLGGTSLIVLTWQLAPKYGTTGAAAALSLVLIITTLVFERLAAWQLKKEALRQQSE